MVSGKLFETNQNETLKLLKSINPKTSQFGQTEMMYSYYKLLILQQNQLFKAAISFTLLDIGSLCKF